MMGALLVLLASASAGELDGRVAVDTLTAVTRTDDPDAGPPTLTNGDVGLSVRSELVELDDRLVVGVDYRGRVPVAGAFRNREQHLLFRADVAWRTKRVEFALGRFFAPSALWLSMDGLRVTWRSKGPWQATGFVGRRAISVSRRNLPLDVLLPVVGAQVGAAAKSVSVSVAGNLAGDQLVLGNPDDEVVENIQGGSAQARVAVRASKRTTLGASASLANDVTFAVGPAVGDLVASARAVTLYRAQAFGQWRMSPKARLTSTFLHQRVGLLAEETQDLALVDPSFTDLRIQSVLGNPSIGFVRPDVRFRARRERLELRFGAAMEAHPAWLRGGYGIARGWFEQGLDGPTPGEHVRWQVGAGFERGAGQIEAGVGMVDRRAGPVSSRSSDSDDPQSQDLSPFVLEAQNVAFLRGFFTARRWFAGADVEANVFDLEVRAFVQVGLIGRTSW